ncbi:chaoptin isoform X1 [Brachionus plicatilis]|uniref:Chaoptin isoform X1 n=1 Tax=Brachionus plicatilis TaxID=10195 RepID=A0A3M7RDN8_BRAPC|nr:chaoptin isoform X1 [Brachionus plicatilis]
MNQADIKLSFKYQTNRFPNEYYCSFYEKNSFSKREHLVDSLEESVPLLPYLDSNWLTEHLGFLIDRNEIATNINSSISLINLIERLKIIEIINFGIETIDSKAFSKFKSLKVLRLPHNDLSAFNFASFTQEDSNEAEFSSNLIELDLSSNKLSNVKIENFMYLNSLRVLNLSCNLLSIFDLHLINVISPHLQVLDLSDNYLKKFKLLENNLFFSSKSKNLSALSLVSNLILNELMYLDLSKNLLTDLAYLFSINLSAFNQTKYCNLSVNSKLKLDRKQRPIIYVNLDDNNWHCDCLSYEFVTSVKKLHSFDRSDSCYLNFLIKENSNLFKNLKIDNLNCSKKCEIRKFSNEDKFNSTITTQTTTQTALITTSYTTTTKIFRSSKIPYSYDISSTFYWICSICIAIVSISCLFVAWYFCWKKYRLYRTEGEPNGDSSSTNSRVHPDQYTQRRNLYFLTNRLNSQFPMNNNWRNRPIADPSLFFISLNQNTGISETVFNNIAYINDDPPNYYEAIMVKNGTNSTINQNEADGSVHLNDFLPIDAPSFEFIGENLADIPEESEGTNQSFRQSTEV